MVSNAQFYMTYGVAYGGILLLELWRFLHHAKKLREEELERWKRNQEWKMEMLRTNIEWRIAQLEGRVQMR